MADSMLDDYDDYDYYDDGDLYDYVEDGYDIAVRPKTCINSSPNIQIE